MWVADVLEASYQSTAKPVLVLGMPPPTKSSSSEDSSSNPGRNTPLLNSYPRGVISGVISPLALCTSKGYTVILSEHVVKNACIVGTTNQD